MLKRKRNIINIIWIHIFYRVSSVLNKDTKSYGKQYLADGKEETCWNSDQGPNQWIIVTFSKPVIVKQIELKFQGGFCSSKFQLESASHVDSKRVFSKLNEFYPQDINSTQVKTAKKFNLFPHVLFLLF